MRGSHGPQTPGIRGRFFYPLCIRTMNKFGSKPLSGVIPKPRLSWTKNHPWQFKLMTDEDECAFEETIPMRLVINGPHVTLEWYVQECALEGYDATTFHIPWPADLPLRLQPSLPENLRTVLVSSFIGFWESPYGDRYPIGLCWNAIERRFDVCNMTTMDRSFETGGRWLLMPVLMHWTKSAC